MSDTREATRDRILQRLGTITDLPTLPHVIAKLNQLLRSPHASVQQVGEILNSDQALTAKTLKLVNSAYYGFSGKVTSINRAIVILGFNKVRNLALGISVVDMFRGRQSRELDLDAFWRHSIATAVVAEKLAAVLELPAAEDAFVAGLLHDMGKLLMALHLHEELAEANLLRQARGLLGYEAERETLGLHHGRVGEFLAREWKFPDRLAQVMLYHHEPLRARQHRDLVFLIHAADVCALGLGLGHEGDPRVAELESDVWNLLELSPAVLDAVFAQALPAYDTALAFFEVVND